jgi:hypothetical protein
MTGALVGLFVVITVLSQATGLFSDGASPLRQFTVRAAGIQL